MKRTQLSHGWLPTTVLLLAVPMAHAQLDASKLLAYWMLDDAGGSTTAVDSSGNVKDAAVVDSSTAANTFGVAGMVGTAWQTATDPTDYPNMLSDYLEASDADGALQNVGSNSFMVTGWFKAAGWGDRTAPVSRCTHVGCSGCRDSPSVVPNVPS